MTFVEKVDKLVPHFKSSYEALCEFAHPNWAGTLGTFGKGDGRTDTLLLGEHAQEESFGMGTAALSGSLIGFQYFYDKLGDTIVRLNDHFKPTKSP
jgi:hypothetical protein